MVAPNSLLYMLLLVSCFCIVSCEEASRQDLIQVEVEAQQNSVFTNGLTYKSYVGPPERYDQIGASQFALLTFLGLRSHHTLLDFGCGSLRAGRLFIPYLEANNYYCVEPNTELVEQGFRQELGKDIIAIKQPHFSNDANFNPQIFERTFDFVLCQSIFSHTNKDLAMHLLNGIKAVMDNNSIALVTFIAGSADQDGSSNRQEDDKRMNWVYPGLVRFTHNEMMSMIGETGLHGVGVNWKHYRQTWIAISPTIEKVQWAAKLLNGESNVINRNVYIDE